MLCSHGSGCIGGNETLYTQDGRRAKKGHKIEEEEKARCIAACIVLSSMFKEEKVEY